MDNKINDIGGLFKGQFDGYLVEPTASVWKGLKFKLWLNSFMKFSFVSFNVYYSAALITLFTTGGVILFENDEQSTSKITITQTTIEQNINSNFVENDNSGSENIVEELRESKNLEVSKDAFNDDINLKDNLKNSQLTVNTIDFNTKKSHKIVSENEQQQNELNIKSQLYNSTRKVISETQIRDVPDVQTDIKDAKIKEEILIDIESLDPVSQYKNVNSTDQADNDNIEIEDLLSPELINKTVFDTVIIYDTIRYFDTIEVNIPKKNINSNWSFDIGFDAMNTTFNYSSDENPNLAKELNYASSVTAGYSAGMEINYHYKNWIFQTGLDYLQVNENFTYENLSTNDSLSEFWNYYPSGMETHFDTLNWQFIFNFVDSSYIYLPVISQTNTVLFDSTLITITNTTTEREIFNNINKYSYLEIPLSLGYNFYKRDNIQVGARLGAKIGMFLNASGKTISSVDGKVVEISNDLPFMMTRINMFVGFPVYYEFRKSIGLILEPNYRMGINSIYNKSHVVSAGTGGIGLKIGIRYMF